MSGQDFSRAVEEPLLYCDSEPLERFLRVMARRGILGLCSTIFERAEDIDTTQHPASSPGWQLLGVPPTARLKSCPDTRDRARGDFF